MGVIHEPVEPARQLELRRAVLELVTHERRRRFPAVLNVGRPGVPGLAFTDRAELDPASRADIVATLLHRWGRPEPPLVWLTRPGELSPHDADFAWLGAAQRAHHELGRTLTMVIVTRRGWYDPRSGTTRRWQRLRNR